MRYTTRAFVIFGMLVATSGSFAQTYCTEPKVQIHTTVSANGVNKIIPHGVTAAVGGGYWVTGTIETPADKLDFMVAKFNDSGRLVLLKRLGTSGDETSNPVGIAATPGGGCVIAGRSDESSVGAGLAALAYINADGSLKWWRRTTPNGNYGRYDAFRNVMVRKNGTVFGTGSSHQWNYNSQLLLAAVDSNGNEIFRNSYRYASQTHMIGSAEYGSGYVVGGHDGSSPVVLTVTASGVVDKCFGYSSSSYCPITSIVLSPSGKLYVTGGYFIGGEYQLFVGCINLNTGNFIWQKRYALNYTIGGKIEWVNNQLLVSFEHTTNGSNWSNGFAEIDSNGNAQTVRLVKFNSISFENLPSGINSALSSKGGWGFVGMNNGISTPNMSLSMLNPCDSNFCTIVKTKFNSVNNTGITLGNTKGTMYYDGKFASNLTPFLKDVGFNQSDQCIACVQPIPTRFNDSLVCKNDKRYYKIADYAAKVLWSDGDTSHTKAFSLPGTYTLSLSNACGTYRDTFEIRAFPAMTAVIPKQLEVCNGTPVWVNGQQPLNQSYAYRWEDGSTNALRNITNLGTYILTTSDLCGSRNDTIRVFSKLPLPVIALKDTAYCELPVRFTQRILNYGVDVIWEDGDTSHIKDFFDLGTHSVTISNSCSFKKDSFEIVLQSPPEKVLKDQEYFCRENGIVLKGRQPNAGTFTYTWSNGVKGPENTVRNQTTLALTTSNACGSRTDVVEVLMSNCDCEMCIPNAFTPRNADGRNDGFKPSLDCKFVDCKVKSSYMRIYDRWGAKLHDAPISEAWDGTYMGKIVPEGNYIYVIHVVYDDMVSGNRIKTESGCVTVLSGNNP